VCNYIDSSALVKLVAREAESGALKSWLREQRSPQFISELCRVEMTRALATKGIKDNKRIDRVLSAFDCLRIRSVTLEQARFLEPVELRTLDAIHLASALSIGPDLESVVTYDQRLAAACQRYGVAVTAPSPLGA